MSDAVAFAINIGAILVVLLFAYVVGSAIERSHYRKIRAREHAYRDFPVVNFELVAPEWRIESSVLAQGSVVVSVDYFKRFLAGLRGLVGGRIKSYEPLLDRARREAMLRMIEDARRQGCSAVINVRLETSSIANQTNNNRQRIAGVEMLAYGTGLKLARGASAEV